MVSRFFPGIRPKSGNLYRLGKLDTLAVPSAFRGQQITIGPQPAENARQRQPAVRPQANGAYFEQPKTRLLQHSLRLPAREKVQRQAGNSLVHRHRPVTASRPLDQRSLHVSDKPSATLRIPEVEPAV